MLKPFKHTLALTVILSFVGAAPLYAHEDDNRISAATNEKCLKRNFSRNTGKCAGKKFPLLIPMPPSSSGLTADQYNEKKEVYVDSIYTATTNFVDSNTAVLLETDPEPIVVGAPVELDKSSLLFPGTAASPLSYTKEDGSRECWMLTNNSTNKYFIPLASDLEWDSFMAAVAPGNSLGINKTPCTSRYNIGRDTVTTPKTGSLDTTFGCDPRVNSTCQSNGAVGFVYKLFGKYNASVAKYWENDPTQSTETDTFIPYNLCSARVRQDVVLRTDYLNIPPQSWISGFPGVSLFEGFAIDYYGRIYVDEDGEYEFKTVSDDAAIVQIATDTVAGAELTTVINDNAVHDAAHSKAPQSITLTKGFHDFRLVYAQIPRLQIALQFMWRKKISGETTDYSFVTLYEPDPSATLTCKDLPAP